MPINIGSNTKADISVKLEMLEILCTSISRYGRFVTLDFQQVMKN